MPEMSAMAERLTKAARKSDRFPIWLPVLLPVGTTALFLYILFGIVVGGSSTPEEVLPDIATPSTDQVPGEATGPELLDPLAIAVLSALYMTTGEEAPPGVSSENLPVLRQWPPGQVGVTVMEEYPEGAGYGFRISLTGPDGTSELVTVTVDRQGEEWIVEGR